MSPKEYWEKHSIPDEKDFRDFLIKSSYGLMGAAWLFIKELDIEYWPKVSIALALIFLLIRLVRSWLVVTHGHIIIDRVSDWEKGTVKTHYKGTWAGVTAEILSKIDILFILGSFIALILSPFVDC